MRFAAEEQARRINQEWQQIKFVSVIHVVASVGFVKEVLVCFSLNRSTWIDVRLWRVVINNEYKHKESRIMYNPRKLVETRLLRQCRRGRESSVQRLLRLGANVHITNQDGVPALTVASGLGRTRLVSALIAVGADVNFGRIIGYCGGTALMAAAEGNHPEAMTVLVHAGADMNQEDKRGITALMLAKKEAAKTLLALGADVNYASAKRDGSTALMYAAGVDVNHVANDGSTALSRYIAALQTATEKLQNADEGMAWVTISRSLRKKCRRSHRDRRPHQRADRPTAPQSSQCKPPQRQQQ